MKIGFAGLGRMGGVMAPRLVAAGFEVTVWNRSLDKARAVTGAAVAQTPADLARDCDIILSILADDAAARDVYDAVAAAPVAGKLFVEMSTLRPDTSLELGARIRAAGGRFIDSPVMGTQGPARDGKLVALVGGEAADLETARPVLEQLTRRILHVGPAGAGTQMKLATNLVLTVHLQALAEATAYGTAVGLQVPAILEAIGESAAGSPYLNIRRAALEGEPVPLDTVSASIGTLRKDLMSIVREAATAGVAAPAAGVACAAFSAACDAGWSERDLAEMAAFQRR